MIYYTMDRLLYILLQATYERYWKIRRTTILIFIAWICNVLMGLVFAVLFYHTDIELYEIIIVYLRPLLMLIYLIFAIITYFTLFKLYKISERKKILVKPTRSTYYIFENSRFHVALIIISSLFDIKV